MFVSEKQILQSDERRLYTITIVFKLLRDSQNTVVTNDVLPACIELRSTVDDTWKRSESFNFSFLSSSYFAVHNWTQALFYSVLQQIDETLAENERLRIQPIQ